METIGKARSNSTRARKRTAIVLLAADGSKNKEIARCLGQDKMKVGRWRQRYAKGGIQAILKDKTRPDRIPALSASLKSRLIHLTVNDRPAGATHWSRTSMAELHGPRASTRCASITIKMAALGDFGSTGRVRSNPKKQTPAAAVKRKP